MSQYPALARRCAAASAGAGDYAQLIARQWAPGVLSDADKRFVAELSDDDTPGNKPAVNLLRVLDIRGGACSQQRRRLARRR